MAWGDLVTNMRILNVLCIVSIAVCFMVYNTEPTDEDDVHPIHKFGLTYSRAEGEPTVDDKLTVNVVRNGILITELADKNVWAQNGYKNHFYKSNCDTDSTKLDDAPDLSNRFGQGTATGYTPKTARTDEECGAVIEATTGGTALAKEKEICRLTAGCKQPSNGNTCVHQDDDCSDRATAAKAQTTDPITFELCQQASIQGEITCIFNDDDNSCTEVSPNEYHDSRHDKGEDCDTEANAWDAALIVFWTWVGLATVGTIGIAIYEAVRTKPNWQVVLGVNCLAFVAHLTFIGMMLWAFSVENNYNMHESGLFKMLKLGHEDRNGYTLKIDQEHGTGYYLLMAALLLSILSGCFTFFRIGHVYYNFSNVNDSSDNAMLYAKMSLL
jgi:hypothetical protein